MASIWQFSYIDILIWFIIWLELYLDITFIQAQIKENIKAPLHWPLCGKFTGDLWIPCTNNQ